MRRQAKFLAVAALALACFGCSNSTQPQVTAPTLVANDTPAHAMQRLVGAYEQEDESAFAGMFAGNYRFEFSTFVDGTLAQQYAAGWFKSDETQSSAHLFGGFDPGGKNLQPATSIQVRLASGDPTDDNSVGVDPITHKILSTRVDGLIEVAPPLSAPTDLQFVDEFHAFYLVRGDAALGLDASQPADTSHWYIYKWQDLTGAPKSNRTQVPHTSWGEVKALYR